MGFSVFTNLSNVAELALVAGFYSGPKRDSASSTIRVSEPSLALPTSVVLSRSLHLNTGSMNGFSTEEDSHDGPPAPPFYGQSCCLIEDGERCGRSAGNASFSKRIQKSISQKKLKLDIDKSVSVPVLCLVGVRL